VPDQAAHDLSLLGLFLQADPLVKAVMILLFLASIVCWAIILDKTGRILRARRNAEAFAAASTGRLTTETAAGGALGAAILGAAMREWRERSPDESRGERRERIERAMRATMSEELRRLESGLPFLATTGSAAPFIGLFGTVWGIMNSFAAIARSNDTSLAVVAPGIAEALFATALGLIAAVPAVIAYNKLATLLRGLSHRLGATIADIGNRMARDPAPLGSALPRDGSLSHADATLVRPAPAE
jgi:biopolymer transport protein TolQ